MCSVTSSILLLSGLRMNYLHSNSTQSFCHFLSFMTKRKLEFNCGGSGYLLRLSGAAKSQGSKVLDEWLISRPSGSVVSIYLNFVNENNRKSFTLNEFTDFK